MDTPPITTESTINDEYLYSAESSDDDFDFRWADIREENAQIRKATIRKELLLAHTYSLHVDHSPSFIESNAQLPQGIEKLPLVDRITIRRYAGDLKEKKGRQYTLLRCIDLTMRN